MFKIFKIIIIIIVFFISNKAYSEVSYINLEELMRKSSVGQYINETFEKEKKKIFNTFTEKEDQLKNNEKKILSQKNILKKEEYQKKVENFKENVKKYKSERKKTIENLNQRRITATKKVIEILNPILTKYMQENSISIILRKKDIIIAKKSLDITSNIIELLNIEIQKINF